MTKAPEPADEAERLAVLRTLRLRDLAAQMDFSRTTRLAQALAQAEYAIVALVEEDVVYALHRTTEGPSETPRGEALSSWAIAADDVLWIEDAATDPRTCGFHFVATPPYIRFYAGAPIEVRGRKIGVVGVSDTNVRPYDAEVAERLKDVAAVIASEFELKVAKDALAAEQVSIRAEKTLLDVLIEDAPLALAMFDREMRYIRTSRRWRDERGLGNEQLIGRCHYDVNPNITAAWKEAHQRCLNGATERCDRDHYYDLNGEDAWVRWEITPWYEPSGAIGGLVIMTEDLTEHVKASQQMEQSETRLRLATEIADLVVWEYSFHKRRLQYASGRMPSVFSGDLPYDRLIQAWLERIHEDDRERVGQLWAHHTEMGSRFHCEYREYDRLGRIVWRQNVADTVRDAEGRPDRIIGVIRDVTEQKLAELAIEQARAAAEAANRAKSEFLANMSHEIRTPLNGVLGVAGALARTSLSADQKQMVDIIAHSGQVLEALLSDVLDLARIESGKFELRPETFDLGGALKEIASLFQASAAAKGLDLVVDLDPSLQGGFIADPVRIRQIVSNLMSNAVKFTTEGSVTLKAVATSEADGAAAMRISVTDTGIGFDDETRQRLFERFEQADGSITRRFGGTGLGLAISRSLADMMGGRLWAESRPGEGSTFTLELELNRASAVSTDAPLLTALDGDLAHAGDPDRPVRVLLAEDHPTNRRVVELILDGAGVELTAVENGALAVEMFGLETYDLILMDMQMPVMDGLNATRSIRAIERAEQRERTPIFALTANAMPEHVEQTRGAGADGHLTKPLAAESLLRVVRMIASGVKPGAEGDEEEAAA